MWRTNYPQTKSFLQLSLINYTFGNLKRHKFTGIRFQLDFSLIVNSSQVSFRTCLSSLASWMTSQSTNPQVTNLHWVTSGKINLEGTETLALQFLSNQAFQSRQVAHVQRFDKRPYSETRLRQFFQLQIVLPKRKRVFADHRLNQVLGERAQFGDGCASVFVESGTFPRSSAFLSIVILVIN